MQEKKKKSETRPATDGETAAMLLVLAAAIAAFVVPSNWTHLGSVLGCFVPVEIVLVGFGVVFWYNALHPKLEGPQNQTKLIAAVTRKKWKTAVLETEAGVPLLLSENSCRSCGKQLLLNAKVCSYCGTSVVEQTPICVHCGTRNPSESKYCGECGKELPQSV